MPENTSKPVHLGQLLTERLSPMDRDGLRQLFLRASAPPEDGHQASFADLPDTAPEQPTDYGALIRGLVPGLREQARQLARQRRELPSLFQELQQHPSERQQVLVINSRRFQSRAFCDFLLDRSYTSCFRQPKEAIQLARLGVGVANSLSTETLGEAVISDLKARAFASLANAYRVASEVLEAEENLELAEEFLATGTGDLLELARLKTIKGALRSDQRRFEECFKLFTQATKIYRQCGETQLLAQALITQAINYSHADTPDKAVELLRESLQLVNPEKDPRLLLAALHNLALYLNDLGQTQEAERLLGQNRHLYHQLGDTINLLRLRWLEGRIAKSKNELAVAETAFLETREAFIKEGILWDVALVSLELVAIYAEQNRNAEIRTLANELVPMFQATGLHREALASLILFQQASEKDAVTKELLRSTMSQLRGLRRDR